MTKDEAKRALDKGYYRDELETEEVYGLLAKYFPEVIDEDKTLEEMVAEALFGGK